MKKYYLACSVFCAFSFAMAQGPAIIPAGVGGGTAQPAPAKVRVDVSNNVVSATNPTIKPILRRGSVNYAAFINLGSSYYDLQTNYAMPHRLVLHSDGAVSGTWTTSPNDLASFPERGAGYNFRTAAGVWRSPNSNRIENNRTGWPSIGLLSNGAEYILAHDATNGGFYFTSNAAAGATPWAIDKVLVEAPYKPIWARTANNGDTIHAIYSYTDSAVAGEKRAPTRKGIFAPMVYSRSLDGGQTWDIQHVMLPDYDSTLTNSGGADQYSIDCKGNTVAIINCDLLQGVIAWKSTDFGTTFTRIIADTFKYAPYNSKKLMLDTPFTNDGAGDVILDANGKMHIFWGLARVMDLDTSEATGSGYNFFPGLQGIVYWNEITKTSMVIASGDAFDRNGPTAGIQPATYAGLTANASGQTVFPNGLSTVARLGSTSAMRHPNASIDPNGNIYCLFSVPIEEDISELDANFRDLGVVYSKDGGVTWGNEQNVTQVLTLEDDFGCTARKANGFLHVMWQQDQIPGTNLQNNLASESNHPPVLNTILYQAIPVSEILNENIGMVWGLKIDQPNTGEIMVVNQNFPNPFHGTTNVLIYLTRPGDVTVSVHNMAGAEVQKQVVSGLMRGNHQITIDGTGLAAGIYTYSLTAGGSTVTKTMVIK